MNKFLHLVLKSFLLAFVLMIGTHEVSACSLTDDFCAESEQSCPPHPKGKKPTLKEITDFKIAFLAKEMELSGDARQKFEKLYAERMNELDPFLGKCHRTEKKLRDDKKLSEEDYAEGLKALEECRQKCVEIETKYDAKFDKILTKKQMYKLHEGERKFRETMRRMPKKKHQHKK